MTYVGILRMGPWNEFQRQVTPMIYDMHLWSPTAITGGLGENALCLEFVIRSSMTSV